MIQGVVDWMKKNSKLHCEFLPSQVNTEPFRFE
jgi:hypothetical protein